MNEETKGDLRKWEQETPHTITLFFVILLNTNGHVCFTVSLRYIIFFTTSVNYRAMHLGLLLGGHLNWQSTTIQQKLRGNACGFKKPPQSSAAETVQHNALTTNGWFPSARGAIAIEHFEPLHRT